MKLEVVAKTNDNKNSVTFRSSVHAFDLRETRLFERGSLAQILFLRDTSLACEKTVNTNTEPCD